MKIARLFFKPKWQHRDAAIRRTAVANSSDAELVAALPMLCRNDTDAGVRQMALRRLNQYEAWRERSTGDSDSATRLLARNNYLALLLGNGNGTFAAPQPIGAGGATANADDVTAGDANRDSV